MFSPFPRDSDQQLGYHTDQESGMSAQPNRESTGSALGPRSVILPGDANLDGAVADADCTVWTDHYRATGVTWSMGDFSHSGEVTEADYTIWADNYGSTAGTVPEPTAMTVLMLGALHTLRRHR
jgi:hypothetical protein